jgi:hypothetical protein
VPAADRFRVSKLMSAENFARVLAKKGETFYELCERLNIPFRAHLCFHAAREGEFVGFGRLAVWNCTKILLVERKSRSYELPTTPPIVLKNHCQLQALPKGWEVYLQLKAIDDVEKELLEGIVVVPFPQGVKRPADLELVPSSSSPKKQKLDPPESNEKEDDESGNGAESDEERALPPDDADDFREWHAPTLEKARRNFLLGSRSLPWKFKEKDYILRAMSDTLMDEFVYFGGVDFDSLAEIAWPWINWNNQTGQVICALFEKNKRNGLVGVWVEFPLREKIDAVYLESVFSVEDAMKVFDYGHNIFGVERGDEIWDFLGVGGGAAAVASINCPAFDDFTECG